MPKAIYGQYIRFEFPLEAVVTYFSPYNGTWLAWLRERAKAGLEVIDMSTAPPDMLKGDFSYTEQLDRAIIGLIDGGAGTAFCPSCNQNFSAMLVRIEDYTSGTYMGGARGRMLRCPNDHDLLHVIDDVSVP